MGKNKKQQKFSLMTLKKLGLTRKNNNQQNIMAARATQFVWPVWLGLCQELSLFQRTSTDPQLLHHSLIGAAVTQHLSQYYLTETDQTVTPPKDKTKQKTVGYTKSAHYYQMKERGKKENVYRMKLKKPTSLYKYVCNEDIQTRMTYTSNRL